MPKSKLLLGLAIASLSLAVEVAPASAKEWYFWVENQSNASIKEVLVSTDNSTWGHFEIGSGIGAGEKAKLIWDQSTNNESCTQWIKASFSDNSESKPASIDFCQDLDTPIVFKE